MIIRRDILAAMAVAGVGIILALLYCFNPTETALAPKCIFRAVTGWSCPGCGMQRFLHAFMHGRILEAFRYNYLLLILLPYLALIFAERLLLKGERQQHWKNIIEGPRMAMVMCIIAPAWFIIRNIMNI